VQVLQGLNHWVGPDEASTLYKDSALEVKSFIIAPPREVSQAEGDEMGGDGREELMYCYCIDASVRCDHVMYVWLVFVNE
jgi:hypothetical protein